MPEQHPANSATHDSSLARKMIMVMLVLGDSRPDFHSRTFGTQSIATGPVLMHVHTHTRTHTPPTESRRRQQDIGMPWLDCRAKRYREKNKAPCLFLNKLGNEELSIGLTLGW